MPAFVERYSAKQRAVLFREAIDHARPVAQVLRAARAGELDGLEPAEQAELGAMGNGYACQLVRQERDERDAVANAAAAPDGLVRELAGLLLKRAERDIRRIASSTGKPMDTGASLQLLKVMREANALLRADAPTGNGAGDAPTDAPAPEPAAPRSLAARIAAQSEPAEDNAHETQSADTARAPTINAPDRNTTDSSTRPVRAGAGDSLARGAV